MRKAITLAVMLAVVSAFAMFPASMAAQEQRGSIEGTVRDASKAVMPGVTIEARSPALVGVQSTTTNEDGVYRFPALRPGRYEITATLQGFSPARVSNVGLELGQLLRVDLTLSVGGLSRHAHRSVRLPPGRDRCESSARRSQSEGGPFAGIHARPRSRAESDDVAGRAVRPQVGGLRGGSDLRAAAEW